MTCLTSGQGECRCAEVRIQDCRLRLRRHPAGIPSGPRGWGSGTQALGQPLRPVRKVEGLLSALPPQDPQRRGAPPLFPWGSFRKPDRPAAGTHAWCSGTGPGLDASRPQTPRARGRQDRGGRTTRAPTEVPAVVSASAAPGGQASGPRFPGRAGARRRPRLGSRVSQSRLRVACGPPAALPGVAEDGTSGRGAHAGPQHPFFRGC